MSFYDGEEGKYIKVARFMEILKDRGIDINGAIYKRLSSKAMQVTTDKGVYIIYVNTIVFKMENGRITLNSGGWTTNTTKKWINYGLDLYYRKQYINQKNFAWFLNNRATGERVEFADNMQLA